MEEANFTPAVPPGFPFFVLDVKSRFIEDDILIVYNVDEIASIFTQSVIKFCPGGVRKWKRVSDDILKVSLNEVNVREFISSHAELSKCQRIFCHFFEELLRNGWYLRASTNFRHDDKKCSLIFHKDPHLGCRPSDGPVLAACLSKKDKLYLFNADELVKEIVHGELVRNWAKGAHLKSYGDNECRFKFHGEPWHVRDVSTELMESRLLIMSIIRSLEDARFPFYASSHPGGFDVATDTIYFTQQRESAPMGQSFMFGLFRSGEIYLVSATTDVSQRVRKCIVAEWAEGIEIETNMSQLQVFRLKGEPWTADDQRGIEARLLVVRIMESLKEVGWRVHCTLDLSRTVDDVSCFMMSACFPERSRFMAISMHKENMIRFINAPEDMGTDLVEEMRLQWPDSLQAGLGPRDCPELTFPYKLTDCLGVFCFLLDKLQRRGWNLVASADLSANFLGSNRSTRRPDDLHTWILEQRSVGPPPVGFQGPEAASNDEYPWTHR